MIPVIGSSVQPLNQNGIGGAVAAAAFTPTDLAGLKIWLDASDITTITKSSDLVSQWDDKSGNGYDYVQATGSSQPKWLSANKNGLDVVDFALASTERFMKQGSAFTEISQPITIFTAAVLPEAGATGNHTLYDGLEALKRAGFQGEQSAGNSQQYLFGGAALYTGGDIGELAWGTVYCLYNGATESEVDTLGVNRAIGNGGTNGITGLTLGAQPTPDNYGRMKIGEIIVYDGNISGDDKALVIGYLQTKWDTT